MRAIHEAGGWKVLLAGTLAAIIGGAASATEVEVSFAMGSILEPTELFEQMPLAPGDTVRTGDDGMVIVAYTGPSDLPGYDWRCDAVFGGGAFHIVPAQGAPADCDVTRTFEPDQVAAAPGAPFHATSAMYLGHGKVDDPNASPQVIASANQRVAFDRWRASLPPSGTGPADAEVVVVDTRLLEFDPALLPVFGVLSQAEAAPQPAEPAPRDPAYDSARGTDGDGVGRLRIRDFDPEGLSIRVPVRTPAALRIRER